MSQLDHYVKNCDLEASLIELIEIRASQINGCAYCIDMHTKNARAAGESEQRIYLLSAWKEAPCYNDGQQALTDGRQAVLFAERRKGKEAQVSPVIQTIFGWRATSFDEFATRNAAIFRGEQPAPKV